MNHKRRADDFEILGLERRRRTDPEDQDYTPERRIVVAAANGNGKGSLTQWAVGLVLAAVLFGWAGFFYFARADMEATKQQVRENHALANENATKVEVIHTELRGISDDIREIKEGVKELRR